MSRGSADLPPTGNGGSRFGMGGPVASLIQAAYNVTHFQIEGGPDWVFSDRYVIDARTPDDATADQKRAMLQSLLADRFQLTLRAETRTIFAALQEQLGLQLLPADAPLDVFVIARVDRPSEN